MQVEIVLLAVFSILFILSLLVYNFGDKIPLKKKEKKAKPEKKKSPEVVKTEGEKEEKKEEVKQKVKSFSESKKRHI